MNKTLFAMIACQALLLVAASPAAALDFCDGAKKCATGSTCHAGVCMPDTMLCKADAGCAGYEVCDFSCPHGSPVVTSQPVSGTSTSSSGSSGSSGSADSPKGSGGSSDSEPKKGGEDKGGEDKGGEDKGGEDKGGEDKGGEDKSGENQGGSTALKSVCPKDIGVCIVKFDKIKPTAACESFCKVAAKCDGFGSSTGSSTGGSAGEPVETGPPKSGKEGGSGNGGSGGSSGSSGDTPTPDKSEGGGDGDGGSDGDDDDDAGKKVPPPGAGQAGNKGGGNDGDNKTTKESDVMACATMCTAIELLKIAPVEMAAAKKCVVDADTKGHKCDKIETDCKDEMTAFGKIFDDNDTLELKLAGGWGASGGDVGATNKGTNDRAAGGESGANGSDDKNAALTSGQTGTPNSGSATGGCTAGGFGSTTHSGALAMMLAVALLLWRRRETC